MTSKYQITKRQIRMTKVIKLIKIRNKKQTINQIKIAIIISNKNL